MNFRIVEKKQCSEAFFEQGNTNKYTDKFKPNVPSQTQKTSCSKRLDSPIQHFIVKKHECLDLVRGMFEMIFVINNPQILQYQTKLTHI